LPQNVSKMKLANAGRQLTKSPYLSTCLKPQSVTLKNNIASIKMIDLKFTVNYEEINITVAENLRLLDILRDELHLTGTKEGCSVGECGACTVMMNGDAVCSCMVLACQVQDAVIETIENCDEDEMLQVLQKSFLESGAVQCGFCTPGMMMSAKALLLKNPDPTEAEIKKALEGNLCRCTGYIQITEAVKKAAQLLKSL
jgi:aerobic-type carbon monoxide dehydrogenase small subunit (CoxS/CutS family)